MLDHPLSDIKVRLAVRHTDERKPWAKRRRSGPIVQLMLVSAVVLASSAAIYPAIPRLYTSTADVLLHSTNQEGTTTWNQSVQDALDDNAIQTKIDMLKSLPLQGVVIRQLNLMTDPEFNPALHPSWLREQAQSIPWLAVWLPVRRSDEGLVAAELVRHLVVLRERKSYLIQVGYSSSNPVKAAWMTDALTKAFLADQIERKRVSHEQLLTALSNRVSNVEKKISRG